jgi:hypothetical protein
MEKKVHQKGKIVTDSNYITQPENTLTFALNAVNETAEGDLFLRSMEESNEAWFELLSSETIILGNTTIANGERALMLLDKGNSIIAVIDKSNNLVIHVNDEEQENKLGFKASQQIQVIYRLRRGCERTLYWVDPKPRVFCLDRPDKFKDENGDWNIASFDLQKQANLLAEFGQISVLNSGGNLKSGSYNVQLQYLDNDFNATSVSKSSDVINIYRDSTQSVFKNIRGSSNKEETFYKVEDTSKAIKIEIDNLDTNFPFYRLAITEAITGTGIPNSVKYTDVIPTSLNTFTYTGLNFLNEGTVEELLVPSVVISEAEHISQLDNMLLLSNTKGYPVDFCLFQKYASQIAVDCITKTVILSQVVGANPKNPLAKLEGLGYMPKEIYSLGIVYVIDNLIETPVYHIPGKNSSTLNNITYTPDSYPMEKDNQCEDVLYTDNSTCEDFDFWGKDITGEDLKNTQVRHHRFPSRKKLGLPLVEEISAQNTIQNLLTIEIQISGELDIPTCPDADPECEDTPIEQLEDILYQINYEDAEGNEYSYMGGVNYDTWSNDDPQIETVQGIQTSLITIISVTEFVGDAEPVTIPITGGTSSVSGLTYTFIPKVYEFDSETKQYKTEILGVRFSNVTLPTPEELNGKNITGFFFVRNVRNQEDRTIVDSAVLTSTLQHENFVSTGLIFPALNSASDPRINRKNYNLITPSHKFDNAQEANFTKITQEGSFIAIDSKCSRFVVQDIFDGSTYRSSRHRKNERDGDGWDLHILSRDTVTAYNISTTEDLIDGDEIEEVFYLDPLESKKVVSQEKEIFNLGADNKTGIVSLIADKTFPIVNSLPYVLLEKENLNPYSNFRSLSYIRISPKTILVNDTTPDSHNTFGGDTYVSSMKYVNTVFVEDRPRQRRGKRGGWLITAGALLLGAAIVIFTAGAGTPLAIAIAASTIAALGTTFAIAGINQASYNKAYKNLYNKGLNKTILDNLINIWKADNPADDEIRWFSDATELWFESSVNMGLRQGANLDSLTDFINTPTASETGNYPSTGIHRAVKGSTELDEYLFYKFTYLDFERKVDNRGYYGYPQPELYIINKDFYRNNLQKIYNMLSIEYDCCSKCTEEFPHRIYNSEQSFEEELSDNYRVFLPNNYRDIEGGTGKITNMFTMGSNLYIHTQHALWHQPQSFQERITQDIVSFIGTGSYFSIPPRKIVDDENNSAGTEHKWGMTKTPYGVIFPCQIENKWYFFSGEKLEPLSSEGNSNWFRQNMKFLVEEDYYNTNLKPYPFRNNPVNSIGTGYVSAFDSTKDRLILTKKDFKIVNLPTDNFELCDEGNGLVIFENISETIAEKEEQGFTFEGIENCQLKFSRLTYTGDTLENIEQEELGEADYIVVQLDYSGSFGTTPDSVTRGNLCREIQKWYNTTFPNRPPGEIVYEGSSWQSKIDISVPQSDPVNLENRLIIIPQNISFEHPILRDGLVETVNVASQSFMSERSLLFPSALLLETTGWSSTNGKRNFAGKNIVYISFVNEASSHYHGTYEVNPLEDEPKISVTLDERYIRDYQAFVLSQSAFSNFKGILYPIVFSDITNLGKALIRTYLASYRQYSSFTDFKSMFPSVADSAFLTLTNLTTLYNEIVATTNPYNPGNPGLIPLSLQELGWAVKPDKFFNVASGTTPVTEEIFAQDINSLLSAEVSVPVSSEVSTLVPNYEVVYVEGTTFEPEILNNGWTFSYSLKEKGFISWHSYIPSYYITETEKFYSWYKGLSHIYKHNKIGSHGFFYENKRPFIIEFVINDQAVLTKIQDYLKFQSTCQVYDSENEIYTDIKDTTFNKLLVYNSYQTSSLLNLITKSNDVNYLNQQVLDNNPENIFIERYEKDWHINGFRDYRDNSNIPFFSKSLTDRQDNYYIDKVVNPLAVNFNKNWFEIENFRDKFLVVRLIYDNFADVKLTMEFSVSEPKISE